MTIKNRVRILTEHNSDGSHKGAYGELYEHETPLQIVFAGAESQDVAGYSNDGLSKYVTVNKSAGTMTIEVDGEGVYWCSYTASCQINTGGGQDIHGAMYLNDGGGFTKQNNISSRRDISASGVYGDYTGHGLIGLYRGDVLKVIFSSSGATTIDIDHMNFTIFRIGTV